MFEKAIKEGDISAIQQFLNEGADPNQLLAFAASSKNQNLLETIVNHPRFTFNNNTIAAIWKGIDVGQTELLTILLKKNNLQGTIKSALQVLENRAAILAAIDACNQITNPDALMLLDEPKISITKEMFAEYRKEISAEYQKNPQKIETGRIKKNRTTRPLSVHFIDDEPYLILPTTKAWKERMKRHINDDPKLTFPKGMISLRTGKIMHVKVLRPKNSNDNMPRNYSFNEHTNNLNLGNKSIRHKRFTQKGVICYLYGDYIFGNNLKNIMKYEHVSYLEALTIMRLLCEALKDFHDKGFIHFDIKPGNIMFDKKKEKLKLIDFEACKKRGDEDVPFQLTKDYSHADVIEAFEKHKKILFRRAIDIFSLIVTMSELLTASLKHVTDHATRSHIEAAFNGLQKSIYVDDKAKTLVHKKLDDLPDIKGILEWLNEKKTKYMPILQPAEPSPASLSNN